MKVGFTLKGKKKPAVAAPAAGGFRVEKEATAPTSKDLVLGFGTSGKALLKDPVAAKAKLVIPLIEQNWTEKGATEADSAAAEALLADIRSTTMSESAEDSTMVIPVAKKPAAGDDAPILYRNKLPGLENLTNENDKFKHDISMRPDDMDIYSDAYEAVPIEEFGAALLRGMGWSGKDRVQPTGSKVQMRHQRLGLGATPKPPMPGDSKKKKRNMALDTKPIRLVEKPREGASTAGSDAPPSARASSKANDRSRSSRDRSRSRERAPRIDSRDHGKQQSRDASRKRSRSRDRKRSRSRDRRHR
ncbi:hypothetical protein SDRG_00461 [Saprolegnia diclina VS20]|uniref:Spp2/MOS2 G-patch domain-containing protein n=1 Tax=Saprolegnia diclina (strain VS20) TaxID=1156394 RepID=T0SBF0_SAPDV|nr:hypothetical protein SDRG_00461 [Saprolegnia diclina VS20]EQC42738.1 hypothetical protein SDRG_00461 [Saprolegnia diclina VS20]|eukprot:XP_008604161.1 hypothetical protein SDRG_00461 [Saprolegnia diclina VS20]